MKDMHTPIPKPAVSENLLVEPETSFAELVQSLVNYSQQHLSEHKREFGETTRNAKYHAAVRADIDAAKKWLRENH